MRKCLIKSILAYCAIFASLAVLLRLPSILQWHFPNIATLAWLVILYKTAKSIKREPIKKKLSFYTIMATAQLILNILFVTSPLTVSVENTLLGGFGWSAAQITVLIMIFLVARSIQSRKLYMRALKYLLYIMFVIVIIATTVILSSASRDAFFHYREQLMPANALLWTTATTI